MVEIIKYWRSTVLSTTQEARENAANGAGKLWRRISLMNVAGYRKQLEMGGQIGDVLGNTTWGIRKVGCYTGSTIKMTYTGCTRKKYALLTLPLQHCSYKAKLKEF